MRSALALVALCSLTHTVAAQDVPFPDFKARIDYVDWYRKQVVGDLKPADNAAESYAACCGLGPDAVRSKTTGFKLPLNGMRTGDQKMPPGGPAPWKPEDHPGWEKSYQETQGALKSAAAAAKLKYVWYDHSNDAEQGGPPTLLDLMLPHLSCLRSIGKGLSEQAWRAPGGKVDAAALLAACETSLRMAQQLDREPMVIARLVAIAQRALVYQDLCAGLKYDVFSSPAARARVLEVLAATHRSRASRALWPATRRWPTTPARRSGPARASWRWCWPSWDTRARLRPRPIRRGPQPSCATPSPT